MGRFLFFPSLLFRSQRAFSTKMKETNFEMPLFSAGQLSTAEPWAAPSAASTTETRVSWFLATAPRSCRARRGFGSTDTTYLNQKGILSLRFFLASFD